MKMSEVFDLPVSVDGFNLNDGHLGVEGDAIIANFDYEFIGDLSESMANHAAHAINNHDRMADEIAELREALQSIIDDVGAVYSQTGRFGGDEKHYTITEGEIEDLKQLLEKRKE